MPPRVPGLELLGVFDGIGELALLGAHPPFLKSLTQRDECGRYLVEDERVQMVV